MTLTLEDVKNVRFPIAKRVGEGYRATEVDDFVDKVDVTFATLLEQNERMKAQIEAFDGEDRPEQVADQSDLAAENARLKEELEQARAAVETAPRDAAPVAAPAVDDAELQRLREENASLREQLDGTRAELEQARQSSALTVMDSGDRKVDKIVVSTAAQASPAVTRLVQLATEQAESVVGDAQAEAQRLRDEAERAAHELTTDAQTRADHIQSEARVNADELTAKAQAEAQRLTTEAQANSDRVNTDAENRRKELFSRLEAERDQLLAKVDHLRGFEGDYRKNLVAHFARQTELVQSEKLEPSSLPELLTEPRPEAGPADQLSQQADESPADAAAAPSSTPRLDALLNDTH
ncbi:MULTISPECIES: DivIVA domain-containing protein [unclassified Luteococcus]|uniref:DivIVA domain-containing protein n=1 Tax=unclassified Luteococcus TaxID=2639923 RepID=UPI00313D497F